MFFHCSETVKFGHVTFVWNGNRSGQFSSTLEKYVEIPSDQGISFDKKPEMKAIAIASKAAEALRSGEWDQVHPSSFSASYVEYRSKRNSALPPNDNVLHYLSVLIVSQKRFSSVWYDFTVTFCFFFLLN